MLLFFQDSDALFHQFNVSLQGVLDIQMLDLALRKQMHSNTQYRMGLSACLETYLPELAAKYNFKAVKAATTKRFAPEKGGDSALWEKRPMDAGMVQYATLDTVFLRVLAATIQHRLTPLYNNIAWEYSTHNVAAVRDLTAEQHASPALAAARARAPVGF